MTDALPLAVGCAALLVAGGLAAAASLARPLALLAALVVGTLLLEQFPIKMESWSVQPAFYDNFNITLGIEALKFNPLEVVLVLLTGAVILRRCARPREGLRVQTVSMLGLAYGAVMVFAAAWGILHGGNWKVALWIVRPVFYFLGVAFLTFQLVRTPRQAAALTAAIAAAVSLKSLQLVMRWIDPGPGIDADQLEAFGSHEDTSFALFVLWFAAAGWFAGHTRRTTWALALVAPVILLAVVVNERRINYATFAVGLAILPFLQRPEDVRRRALVLLLLAAAGFTYLVVGWFGPDIPPFSPVKGIKQGVRAELVGENTDASSWYRKVERFNLRHTLRSAPLLGTGLGVPYLQVIHLDKLSFGYAIYITHNQVLLVHATTGAVGYFTFLVFHLALVAQLALYSRVLVRPWHRSVAVAAVLFLMNWLIVGYYDMQLFFFRNSIVAGAVVGIPGALYRWQVTQGEAAAVTPGGR